jgi:hypothetical protein
MPSDIGKVTHRETYAAKIPKSVSFPVFCQYHDMTLRQAVCALAGFYVGEQYNVPWATTDVPAELQMQISPFAEDMERNQERLCGEEETQQANKSEVHVFQN